MKLCFSIDLLLFCFLILIQDAKTRSPKVSAFEIGDWFLSVWWFKLTKFKNWWIHSIWSFKLTKYDEWIMNISFLFLFYLINFSSSRPSANICPSHSVHFWFGVWCALWLVSDLLFDLIFCLLFYLICSLIWALVCSLIWSFFEHGRDSEMLRIGSVVCLCVVVDWDFVSCRVCAFMFCRVQGVVWFAFQKKNNHLWCRKINIKKGTSCQEEMKSFLSICVLLWSILIINESCLSPHIPSLYLPTIKMLIKC